MKKRIIDIDLDIWRFPIFCTDIDTGELFTGINAIDKNDKIRDLNFKIGNMYSNCFELESHGKPCWFNKDQFNKDKSMLLCLLENLIAELNLVNDGSYEVIDKVTDYINNFK